MTTRILVVSSLCSTITLHLLKQVFEQFGSCAVELNSERKCALVKYTNDEICQKAKDYLDNSDLVGLNGQTKVNIQILNIPLANQQPASSVNTSISKPYPETLQRKLSQQKDMANNFSTVNNTFTLEGNGQISPFQQNNQALNNKVQNHYQMNSNFSGNDSIGLRNITNKIDPMVSIKEQDSKPSMFLDSSKTTQSNFVTLERLADHEYLKSKINSSPKISKLVQFYQANKLNSISPKVKAYSSYQEFALDMQTLPKVKETHNFNESKLNSHNEGLKDIDTLTIAELTAELRKAGVNVTGSKQMLKYTLERIRNENWVQRG